MNALSYSLFLVYAGWLGVLPGNAAELGGITALAAGARHTCAITASGALKCWGINSWGQVGYGPTNYQSSAVGTLGLGGRIAAVTGGFDHTCALTAVGAVKCWGINDRGQLGDGTQLLRRTPVDVLGLSGGVAAIGAGRAHTCALTGAGGMKCWGANQFGELGDGTVSLQHLTLVDVAGLDGRVRTIAVGGGQTCALLADGRVPCWGDNSGGQVGGDLTGDRQPTPYQVIERDRTIVEFYNAILDNYFVMADPIEISAIDNGSAGPGWSRTGGSFKSGGDTEVCRFYGSVVPEPNSHFFALDGDECQGLIDRQFDSNDPRRLTIKNWNFESFDFISTRPVGDQCPVGTVPVYRAYNNGFALGVDSNHRISASQAAIAQVVARGWINEGVVMCAPT